MNKKVLIFAARTKEALKSYVHLKNLNINDYVMVKIPDRLRQNKVIKSLVNNIDNPDVRYMMVLKDCVSVSNAAKPVLNVTALKENAYANQFNNPDVEKVGDKTVSKDGQLKSVITKLQNSNLDTTTKNYVISVIKSKLGEGEAVPASEEFVTGKTKVKNMDMMKGKEEPVMMSMHEEEEEDDPKKNAVGKKSYGSKMKNVESAEDEKKETKKHEAMESKEHEAAEHKDDEDEDKKKVTKSIFSKRDLVEENRQLLKSLGSLSEEEGIFTNIQMARRYARLFNEKIASPSQRAEVVSPSVKDVQRFGKRAKSRVNLV